MTNVMDKIRKLFRLANDKGATENERDVALEMAHALMLRHNIKDVEEDRVVEAVLGEWMHVDKDDQWEVVVSIVAATLYSCRSVHTKSGSYQFVGKPENNEAAGETFLFVCAQIEVLYKEALRVYDGRLNKAGRAELRKTFKYSCALRCLQRAREIVAKSRNDIPSHMALVVIDQSLAAADELIKDVKKSKARPQKIGIGSHAGWEAGDRVRLQGTVGDRGDK